MILRTKKYFSITFFSILILTGVAAQEPVRVTYTVEQKVDFDSINSVEVADVFMLVNEVISGFEFELLMNENGEAIFRKTEPMIEDFSQIELYRLALGFSAGDEIWYTKKEDSEKLIFKNDLDNGPLLLNLNEDVTWKISNETKLIGKYQAKKATTTRKMGNFEEEIEAWFTPDVPYAFGPIGYNGLPGLILEMKRGKIVYKFKELEKTAVFIRPPTVSKHMSFNEYYLLLESQMAEIKSGRY